MSSKLLFVLVSLLLCFKEINTQYNHTQVKYHNWRRMCTMTREVNKPIKVTETYTKPVMKKFTRKCENDQVCNGVKVVYETAYRDVYKPNIVKVPYYACCPGWMADKKPPYGCNEAGCAQPCQNGGTCVGQKCSCLPGFAGKYCEIDIDECIVDKPCDHFCMNTKGSYYCSCKDTFTLQEDKQSCRKNDGDTNNTAFEAEDLDYDMLDKRVLKLEKMMGMDDSVESSDEVNVMEMKNKLDIAVEDIVRLEHKVKELEYRHPRIPKVRNRHHPRFQRIETDNSKKQHKHRAQELP